MLGFWAYDLNSRGLLLRKLYSVLQGCALILVHAHPHNTLLLTAHALQCRSELKLPLGLGLSHRNSADLSVYMERVSDTACNMS